MAHTGWQTDEEKLAAIRRDLFTAVVGDVMDQMGLLHQFLPPSIRPLRADMVTVGRAMPVRVADLKPGEFRPDQPFGLMLEALDDLRPGEVYFAAGGAPEYALWGELMATRAMKLGAAGAVMHGYSRDTPPILEMGFPTFSMGCYAQDQGPRGTVAEFRVPLQIGAVRVAPGDLVFGDVDGVAVVPREAEEEVLRRAFEKAGKENLVREAIAGGMASVEAFARFGVM